MPTDSMTNLLALAFLAAAIALGYWSTRRKETLTATLRSLADSRGWHPVHGTDEETRLVSDFGAFEILIPAHQAPGLEMATVVVELEAMASPITRDHRGDDFPSATRDVESLVDSADVDSDRVVVSLPWEELGTTPTEVRETLEEIRVVARASADPASRTRSVRSTDDEEHGHEA